MRANLQFITTCRNISNFSFKARSGFSKAASEWRVCDFNAQSLANTAWAFAMTDQTDAPLFAVLSRATERCVCDFDAQNLANTAWAFARVSQADSQLFVALARIVRRLIGHFNTQDLANTA